MSLFLTLNRFHTLYWHRLIVNFGQVNATWEVSVRDGARNVLFDEVTT